MKGFIYVLYNPKTRLHKIGMTVNPSRRIAEITREKQSPIATRLLVRVPNMQEVERRLHMRYALKLREGREWFALTFADIAWLDVWAWKVRQARKKCPTCGMITGGHICDYCHHEHTKRGLLYSATLRRLVPLTATNALLQMGD